MNQTKLKKLIPTYQKKTKSGQIRFMLFVLMSAGLLQMGCGRKEAVYLETPETEKNQTEGEDTTEESRMTEEKEEMVSGCYVYVCGAVTAPGVYFLPEGSRVYEALMAAGGMLAEAENKAVNQAEMVTDGQMIWIPTKEEAAEDVFVGGGAETAEISDGKVNLNTAGIEELMTLPGIGQSKAEKIVSYRAEHGNFASVEELMNVEGIKEGVFNRVKDSIKVK